MKRCVSDKRSPDPALVDLAVTTSQPAARLDPGGIPAVTADMRVTPPMCRSAAEMAACDGVTDQKSPPAGAVVLVTRNPLAQREPVAKCASSMAMPICYWCSRPFRARRTGGRAQRFCRLNCRRQFHAAVRRWTLDAIGSGALTLGDIKEGFQRTCALLQASSDAVGVTG
jgi:hypothetical protein